MAVPLKVIFVLVPVLMVVVPLIVAVGNGDIERVFRGDQAVECVVAVGRGMFIGVAHRPNVAI